MALGTIPIYRGPSHEDLTAALMDPYPLGQEAGTRRVTFMDEDGQDYVVRVFAIHTLDGDNCDVTGNVFNRPGYPRIRIKYSVFTRKGTAVLIPENTTLCLHCLETVEDQARCPKCGHSMCP